MGKFTSKQIDKLHETLEFKQKEVRLKFSDPFSLNMGEMVEVEKGLTDENGFLTVDKKVKPIYENGDDTLKRMIVANTYLWMDSHDDVHLPGIFKRSIQHKGLRVPHLHDHIFQLDAKVGRTVSLEEMDISWRQLGISKAGSTQALIAVSEVQKKLNEKIFDAYKDDEIDQHSVSMRYIDISLAMNDEDSEESFKLWQEWIGKIGNREKVEQQGFFFAVAEAELAEYSAVLAGSNELTPTLKTGLTGNSTPEQTQVDEPTQHKSMQELLNNYNFNLNF